ncbi:MAG: hypothetical protein JWQ24_3200 [Tardiphaga sp.]|nr:hypothetical protein [Tardiphaga sp.]
MSIRPAKSRVERRLPAVAARELAGQPSQSSTQAIFLPAMIVLLGVLLPGSLVFNQVSAQAYPEWPGSLVIAVYTGVRLAGFLVSGNQRLYCTWTSASSAVSPRRWTSRSATPSRRRMTAPR